MRPDVVFGPGTEVDSKRLIVLDAQYRIEEGLAGALSSIHTYRDVLVHDAETNAVQDVVRAAYLLAPNVPDLYGGTGCRETAMPGRLFQPEYRRNFRFGAKSLRHGMALGELRDVLRTIVADATREGTHG